jgi:hypothetical protein
MADYSWLGDLGDFIFDAFSAKDKSGKKLNLGELFKMANPNIDSPFMTTRSVWDAQNKQGSQIREFTPEVQGMFDQIVSSLATPTQGYAMSRGMDELQNANLNWQRERYDLDPVPWEYQDAPMIGSGYAPMIGGGNEDDTDIVRGGGRPSDTDYGDNYQNAGLGDGYAGDYGNSTLVGGQPAGDTGQWNAGDRGGIIDAIQNWYQTRRGTGDGYISYDDLVQQENGNTIGNIIAGLLAAAGLPATGALGSLLTGTDKVWENYVGQLEPREGSELYNSMNPNQNTGVIDNNNVGSHDCLPDRHALI